MKAIKYNFQIIEKCNMCGSNPSMHNILGRRLNKSQGKNPSSKIGISTTIMKCKNCDLIFSNPQPIPNDIQDHYGVAPENYWAENYFKLTPDLFQTELKTLGNILEIKPNAKALDIGAGIGKSMIALSNAGFDTYGFEPSEEFYKTAIEKMKINHSKLKLGMIENINYPENEFDFITFGAVLEHLYSPSEAINKAMRWLKPEGIVHIEVPSSRWLIHKLVNFYYGIKGKDYVANLSPMHTPYHLYEFALKSFKIHGEENNYEIAFHEYFVCSTYMPKGISWVLKQLMNKTNTGMQLTVWLRKK